MRETTSEEVSERLPETTSGRERQQVRKTTSEEVSERESE